MRFSLIIAHDTNYIIGEQDKLPWQSKEDMSWFIRKTRNKAIVMGGTTFRGIGKVLPNRENYVLSRNPGQFKDIPGLNVYSSIEDIAVDASRKGYDEVVICGGLSIYKQFLSRVEKIYLTVIPVASLGDVELDIPLLRVLCHVKDFKEVYKGWALEEFYIGEKEGCQFSTLISIQKPLNRF